MTEPSFSQETLERIRTVESSLVSPQARKKNRTLHERRVFLRVPGVSIAVMHNGAVEWAKGYGLTTFEGGQPVDADTLFQAASISKPVTSMLVMRLVEDGALDLDADINTFLRSWKLPQNEHTTQEKVTLRHLLCHDAGTTVHGFPGYEVEKPLPTLPQVLDGEVPANTKAVRVARKPGEKHSYSGGGTTIVQLACMEVTGRPFPDLMQEYVLRPLGMTRSAYDQPLSPERMANAARAHKMDRSQYPGGFHVYPEMAAAGLWTTPSDLLKALHELQQAVKGEGKLLKQATAQEMLKPQIKETLKTISFLMPTSWGIGFALHHSPQAEYFGHSGGNAGFNCNLLGRVDLGEGAAVMTNGEMGTLLWIEIFNSIAEVYGWPGYDPKIHFGLRNLPMLTMFEWMNLKLRFSK
jgi:CubicO group peptidase (beta-lactamase class C family)